MKSNNDVPVAEAVIVIVFFALAGFRRGFCGRKRNVVKGAIT